MTWPGRKGEITQQGDGGGKEGGLQFHLWGFGVPMCPREDQQRALQVQQSLRCAQKVGRPRSEGDSLGVWWRGGVNRCVPSPIQGVEE